MLPISSNVQHQMLRPSSKSVFYENTWMTLQGVASRSSSFSDQVHYIFGHDRSVISGPWWMAGLPRWWSRSWEFHRWTNTQSTANSAPQYGSWRGRTTSAMMTGMGRVWRSMLSSAESANKYREKCYPNSWILCWKEFSDGVLVSNITQPTKSKLYYYEKFSCLALSTSKWSAFACCHATYRWKMCSWLRTSAPARKGWHSPQQAKLAVPTVQSEESPNREVYVQRK